MSLPTKSTRVLPRPCSCDKVTGPEYTPDQCHLCWLVTYNPMMARQWSGPGDGGISELEQAVVLKDEQFLCQFRAERIRVLDCGCSTKLIVFRCDAAENEKNECILWEPAESPGLPVCKGCPWRIPPAEVAMEPG